MLWNGRRGRWTQWSMILSAIVTCGLLTARAEPGPLERGHFEHEERNLAYFCAGDGSPTLILEAPSGLSNEEAFRNVLPDLTSRTRVCAYERAGFGSSSPLPAGERQTTRDYARELHAFVTSTGQATPLVLVGFSYGGFVARYFAATRPDAVAGLVLIDSPHEHWLRTMKAEMTEADWSRVVEILRWFIEHLGHDVWASQFEVEAAPPLRENLPVVVVTRGQDHERMRLSGVSEHGFRIYNDAHFELAPALEKLSRNLLALTAPCSDHMIPDREPDVVIAAVEAVLGAVNSQTPLESAAGGSRAPRDHEERCAR